MLKQFIQPHMERLADWNPSESEWAERLVIGGWSAERINCPSEGLLSGEWVCQSPGSRGSTPPRCHCTDWPPSMARWDAGPRSSHGQTERSASSWCPIAEAVRKSVREWWWVRGMHRDSHSSTMRQNILLKYYFYLQQNSLFSVATLNTAKTPKMVVSMLHIRVFIFYNHNSGQFDSCYKIIYIDKLPQKFKVQLFKVWFLYLIGRVGLWDCNVFRATCYGIANFIPRVPGYGMGACLYGLGACLYDMWACL